MATYQPESLTPEQWMELTLRDASAARAMAESVLLTHEVADVRASAANLLGSGGGSLAPDAVPALTRATADPSAAVRRRAARGIGRLGTDPTALETLAADPDAVVRRSAEAALVLMSYRIGEPLRLVPDDAADVVLETPRGAAVGRIDFDPKDVRGGRSGDAERDLPTVEFASSELLAFRCGKQEVSVVATRALTAPGDPVEILARPRILAALVRYDTCSDGGQIAAYVLSDDRDASAGRDARLWVVRGNGTVLHGGRARADDSGIAFILDRSNPPYGPPVLVQGRLDLTTMSITVKGRTGPLPDGRRARVPMAVAVQG